MRARVRRAQRGTSAPTRRSMCGARAMARVRDCVVVVHSCIDAIDRDGSPLTFYFPRVY